MIGGIDMPRNVLGPHFADRNLDESGNLFGPNHPVFMNRDHITSLPPVSERQI